MNENVKNNEQDYNQEENNQNQYEQEEYSQEQPEDISQDNIEEPEESPDQDNNEYADEEYEDDNSEQEQVKNKDYNFRNLREAREKAEKERDEALAYAYQYYQQLQNQQQNNYGSNAEQIPRSQGQQVQQQKNQNEIEDVEELLKSFEDDELVDGKKVKKALHALSSQYKRTQESVKEQQNRIQMQQTEREILNTYSDFDEVVNDNSIRMLNKYYPNTAISLSRDPDVKTKALAVYEAIKSRGLNKKVVKKDYSKSKKRVQDNAMKPRSSSGGTSQRGDTPMSKANEYSSATHLTEEDKKRLREHTKKYAGQY